jgi:hypothetical protein
MKTYDLSNFTNDRRIDFKGVITITCEDNVDIIFDKIGRSVGTETLTATPVEHADISIDFHSNL